MATVGPEPLVAGLKLRLKIQLPLRYDSASAVAIHLTIHHLLSNQLCCLLIALVDTEVLTEGRERRCRERRWCMLRC